MEAQTPEPPSQPVPRRPLLALVLSLPAPGLGHLYNGHPVQAFAIAALFVLIAPISVIAWSQARFAVHLLQGLLFLSGPIAFLVIGIWAALQARRQPPRVLEKWQRPLGYGTFFLVVTMTGFLISNYVQANFARQIDVQNDALAPEIMRGDTVWLVKTRAQKLPARGAHALYAPSEAMKPPLFIRIEALHPDKVAVKEGAVFINGEKKFDAPGAKELPETELGLGQAFGIAPGRDPAKNVFDSRDVGPIRHGDYLGTVGVIGWRKPDPNSNGRNYLNKWLVAQ